MTNTNQTVLELMGLDKLSEEEQAAVMGKFGQLVIEASVGQLLLTLDENQVKTIEDYTNNLSGDDDVFTYLLKTYPDFQSIVEKQIAAMKDEITEIYSKSD